MKSWVSIVIFALGVTFIVSGSAASQTTTSKPQTVAAPAADSNFVRTASLDGMAEVEHGRLAAQNAAHSQVKEFAQRMVDDHSKAGSELKSLAANKQVTVATELDKKHQAMQDKLSALKGAAFDRAYMAHMVTAHQQAVALFQQEAKSGKDADLKAWAEKTLPTLQEHLKLAKEVNAAVVKSTSRR